MWVKMLFILIFSQKPKLTCDLNHRPLNQERLQYDNQMIQMGLRREKKLTEDLSKLMTKKAKLLKLKK